MCVVSRPIGRANGTTAPGPDRRRPRIQSVLMTVVLVSMVLKGYLIFIKGKICACATYLETNQPNQPPRV